MNVQVPENIAMNVPDFVTPEMSLFSDPTFAECALSGLTFSDPWRSDHMHSSELYSY